MSLNYSELVQLYKTHPAWRLLRADNAPLILAFLDRTYIQPNIRVMNQSNLVSKLDDTLYQFRETAGDSAFTRSAREYLDDWAQNDKGWLRKFYSAGSDEPHFDLTPATEKALAWIESLVTKTFVGTESRLRTIFDLLKQMVLGAETDASTRIAELEKQRNEIDNQIRAIRNGEIPVLDETALRERFMQFSSMARELLSDFRSVEHNFRQLDMQVREKIATWDGRKGDLLEIIFGERDVITDSDQGKSFRAFWDFLMSSKSQEEFTDLLEKIFSMAAVSTLTTDKRLKRIHFDWLEAGEQTQRTVASVSQQLRRYLDNQAYLENKRIMQILDSIGHQALAVKEHMPEGTFMSIDEQATDIRLPMDRPLFTPATHVSFDSLILEANEEGIDAGALFNQVHVDKAKLLQNIQKELQVADHVSLGSIVEKYPLSNGLAELVTYMAIASSDRITIFDESSSETIQWKDNGGILRKATLPRVIFNRK